MEKLIFLLFILFSLFSWLMERRKRKRQREAQQQGGSPRGESQESAHEPEDEGEGGWPFPVDPFELETKKPRRVDVLVDHEAEDVHQSALEERERAQEGIQAQQEQRAKDLARQAEELERRSRQVQPRRRIQEMVREKMAEEERHQAHARTGMDFRLSPEKVREAIIYTEILGPPKSERGEGM